MKTYSVSDEFCIKNENYILLHYDFLKSFETDREAYWSEHDGFYRECRSLVIDLTHEKMVLTPFRKFFNIGELAENSEDKIREEITNAKLVEITEKYDGSMQSARWYRGQLYMSGSESITLEQSWRLQIGRQMIESQPNYVEMIKSLGECTFIFELISMQDPHVVRYSPDQEGMYLIGIRNTLTGMQYPYREVNRVAEKYGVKTSPVLEMTLDKVIDSCKKLKAEEHEGYVINIFDNNFNSHMVKIKGDDYVAIHSVLSKIISPNTVIRSLADGTYDDLCAKLPVVYKSQCEQTAEQIKEYINIMESSLRRFYRQSPTKERKQFAIWVNSNNNTPKPIRKYLMMRYDGKPINFLKKHDSGYKTMSEISKDKEGILKWEN